MTRMILSPRERRVAWFLTQLVLLGAFAIGALAVRDIVQDRPDGGDPPSAATTMVPPAGTGTDEAPAATTTEATTTTTWEPARSFTLVATGELLVHEYVADRAADYGGVGTWDFRPMFRLVRPILSGADVALCHLETPLSADNSDLAYYPGFRVPFELADAIADAGYDGCSVASNHSLDAGTAGVASTLDHLERAGVATTGMAVDAAGDVPATFEADGISIAHLSYTDLMNGGSLPTEPARLVPRVDADEILADAAAARATGAEFVVLSLHWGTEYETAANSRQETLVETLLASPDVDLILGHGTHVPQPVVEQNDKYAVVGLGNFLSNQPGDERRMCSECPVATQDGLIAWFAVGDLPDGSVGVVDAGYVPTWVRRSSTYEIVPLGIDEPADVDPAVLAESANRTAAVVGQALRRLTIDSFG
ncbi:MAG TPA: CapA family protein [Acidimicrobiales bacterium]|jgi:poly-gamma-glutamate synthesis protein (capsule biosynthesis protein)|nr:CapA family protein [Actinomycetes bacterium]MDP6240538.1 CapA family protein [Acidimicrobiales bacterium]MDP7125242.1 CapA family protein [Acidimicrobiales bacterium]MDP7352907.1 CapA family protein [Acidimicrobiales bacterium]MDP7507270.1 CapA family protein [Acidimicrobiales bacterium]|tara:strand:+ start:17371 stop:18639 length:1269 start_codon:yes stop_codon:yes gene_type:complete